MRIKLPRRIWNPWFPKITQIVEDLYTNIYDEGLQKTSHTQFYKEIQLFQERLSYKSVKAKGIIGNAVNGLLD